MKNVAIFESQWIGHHPYWFVKYCEEFLKNGLRVYAYCPEPNFVSNWAKENFPVLADNIICRKLDYSVGKHFFARKISALRNKIFMTEIREIINKHNASNSAKLDFKKSENCKNCEKLDFVFFACLVDGFFPKSCNVDKFIPLAWSALLIDCTFLRLSGFKKIIKYRGVNFLNLFCSKNLQSVIVIEEDIAPNLKAQLGKEVVVCPDFTDADLQEESYDLNAKIAKLAKARKICGLIGFINKGKGLLNFLRITKNQKTNDWFFICCGEISWQGFSKTEIAEIKKIIADNKDKLFVHFNKIPTESNYYALIQQCNVLLLPYINFHRSSNSLAKAARFQVPVITSALGCTKHRVEKFQLGFCYQQNDTDTAVDLLKNFDNLFKPEQAKFQEYLAQNTNQKFSQAIQNTLKHANII